MSKNTMIVPSGVPINRGMTVPKTPDLPANIDTFIVSYPKCGRTWLRSIIGKYLVIKYELDEKIMLNTEAATSASQLTHTAFTHDSASMLDKLSYLELYYPRTNYTSKNVILMGRDLKDTMVSAYFQATKRVNVFDGPISQFIKSDQYGIRKLLAFYDVWKASKLIPQNYLYITYEDLHSSPMDTLRKVFDLMGEGTLDEAALEASLEFNSFDNQQKREASDNTDISIVKAADTNDPESYKARKGQVGGYKEYLTEEDEQFIDDWVAQFQFDFSNLKR